MLCTALPSFFCQFIFLAVCRELQISSFLIRGELDHLVEEGHASAKLNTWCPQSRKTNYNLLLTVPGRSRRMPQRILWTQSSRLQWIAHRGMFPSSRSEVFGIFRYLFSLFSLLFLLSSFLKFSKHAGGGGVWGFSCTANSWLSTTGVTAKNTAITRSPIRIRI